MKKIFLLVLLVTCGILNAQIPPASSPPTPGSIDDDTTQYRKEPYTYGVKQPRVYATKVLRTPKDTIYSKSGIAIFDSPQSEMWYGDEVRWWLVGSAATGVLSVDAGDLSPLFTTSVTDPTGNAVINFALSNTTQYTVFGRSASGSGVPSYVSIDTTWISSFSVKVRSLISATSPVVYSNGNISLDTAAGKWRSENYYNTVYTPLLRSISTGYGLSGGGNFTTNRTFILDSATVFPNLISTIALTTDGTSGAATWNPTLRILNIPNYAFTETYLGTVTSVGAGAGMDFTAITGSGNVVMGTPSSTTLSSTNNVTGTTHTHAFAPGGTSSQVILGNATLGTYYTGTVTSVGFSGGTTGLTATGSPITSTGTFTLGGTLVVSHGGTGATSFTQYGVIYGNGTSALQVTAVGLDGQLFIGTGSAPIWGNTVNRFTRFMAGLSTTDTNYKANLWVASGRGYDTTSHGGLQFEASTINAARIFLAGADTVKPEHGEIAGYMTIDGSPIREDTTGTHPLLYGIAMRAPQIISGDALVANTATLYIEGAPQAIVETGGYNSSIWIKSGNFRMGKEGSNTGSFSLEGSTAGRLDISVANNFTDYSLKWPTAAAGGTTYALIYGTSGQMEWYDLAGAAGVTDVTATGLLTSSGGTTPDISSSMAQGKLVGRGASSGTGIFQEISLGGILSMSGTTLSATEVDGLTTNEVEQFASISDATSHTLRLFNSTFSTYHGSYKVVEGSGITMATTGDALDAIVTITATDNSASNELQNFTFTSSNSPDYLLVELTQSTKSFKLQAGTNITFTHSGTSDNIVTTIAASGSSITADNGLTMSTATNAQWGGTLLANTTIAGGTSYASFFTGNYSTATNNAILNITQSHNSGGGMYVNMAGTGGTGITVQGGSSTTGFFSNGTGGTGFTANMTSGTGANIAATTGTGAQISATTGLPLLVWQDNTSTNAVNEILRVQALSSGTPAAGLGGSIDFYLESTSQSRVSNQLISKWSTATDASRSSTFILTGVNSGTTADLLTIVSSGKIRGNTYGSGTHTGTATYDIQTDASGNFIEVANVTTSSGTYTPTLTHSENVASSSAYQCQWMRVGDVVTVSGKFTVGYSSAPGTFTRLGISLPVGSVTFGVDNHAGGVASEVGSFTNNSFPIRAVASTSRVEFAAYAPADMGEAQEVTYWFTFTYLIIAV